MRRVLGGIDRWLTYFVSAVVVLLLTFMVTLSFTQVILRNIAGHGIPWAEIVLQHSVLAVGMFGAVLAAHQGRQIAIDVFSRISGPLIRRILAWVGGIFTITISIILAHGSWVFVLSEREFSSELVEGLPAWPFQLVLPIGFSLLAAQVLINLLLGRLSATEQTQKNPTPDLIHQPDALPNSDDREEA